MMRTCVICDVGISARKHNALTCSPACARENRLVKMRAYANKVREDQGDKIRSRQREHYQRNASKRIAETKAYYQANRERIRERERVRRRDEAAHLRSLAKARYEKNRDKQLEKQRARYAADGAVARKCSRDYASRARAALRLVSEIQSKGLEALL